ncbi:hypothetical protein Droror1_Dr00014381 [Drosera rotundifolia]
MFCHIPSQEAAQKKSMKPIISTQKPNKSPSAHIAKATQEVQDLSSSCLRTSSRDQGETNQDQCEAKQEFNHAKKEIHAKGNFPRQRSSATKQGNPVAKEGNTISRKRKEIVEITEEIKSVTRIGNYKRELRSCAEGGRIARRGKPNQPLHHKERTRRFPIWENPKPNTNTPPSSTTTQPPSQPSNPAATNHPIYHASCPTSQNLKPRKFPAGKLDIFLSIKHQTPP